MTTSAMDQPLSKSSVERDRRIYSSRKEQMKYLMRRVRGSILPHYPELEPKASDGGS